MPAISFSRLPLMAVLAGALALAACDRKPEQGTVGQQVDSAIAKAEQKTQAVIAKVEQKTDAAATTIGQKTEQAMYTASAKMKDAAITTSINAELTRDKSLSALKINVDTTAGRVLLKGSAPDAGSRDRATQLAQQVQGVVAVDNQLKVRSN